MAEVKLTAQVRTDFGKGAARRARRADLVPAVIYGHGAEPQHVAINNHALMMALKTPNALLRLEFDGKNELVIPKAVQREAIRGFLVHADFLAVKKGEKVNVELPIHTEGELAPGGNLLEYSLNTLPVEAEATHIPESVTVSIAGLDAGHSVQAKDIALPAGVSLAVEDDAVVLQVVAAQAEAPAEEAAEGEGAEGAEA
ncbi:MULTISPECIES: 50S ribosomal protein L25/general stress protein Ctc [Streptomyces]|uniref:Large ribosomal subunit protein bL25 n=2 Tax=Streptomyces nigrescens TaxID=1920 RepID=A0A640TK00_STRNI|nr:MULTISPECIES: 50S ribosomal protein L25/general stress protein Ctc [Streptomyces]MCW7985912.1 50S ribosomal protein L25 [Streptomyces platensis subsp. clarensis]AWN27653.1 50S ribosomal protein L25 [Streptomyces sp. NEAU-S7GS2]MCR8576537.1 50S ribosomal protein L25/general stress protein Ctc [Streptomyces sp. Isolate_219]MYT11613.1 50S ribosomal protein L25/general stress protein Ctc [Streptomyces sp. SID4951]MYX08961.1 50S ribosomal protein L25/general stress protein Ctc [Streptomyces sp. 